MGTALALAGVLLFPDSLTTIGIGALGGLLAGAGARFLLKRLARGATAPPGSCELPTAALWAYAAARWQAGAVPAWWLPTLALLTWFAVTLAVVDLRHRRLPDALTVPAIPIALAVLGVAAITGPGAALVHAALIGSLVFGSFHAIVHLCRPTALGQGDVKLAPSLGAVLGALGPEALILAPLLASATTLLLHVSCRRPQWRTGIPHGPGLLAATCLLAMFPANF
ncbi:prepilin peptidase [Actinokineospora iranica]|uniref:prepilin peptidase n=1 Tax=Actinokineospora iranica TaxID=1271860 RepID=UPI001E30833D|nr:A24 family peptidase [Actinokineospora iranica]